MNRNIVQRHAVFFTLLMLCFLLVWAIRESYAQEEMDKKTAKQQQKQMELYKKQQARREENKRQERAKAAKYIVMLDAGHGGYDAGSASKKGDKEKDITLAITKKVGAMLEEYGVQVLYTRTSDKVAWKSDNVDDLNTRSALANASQADLFVSIHTNYSDEAKEKTAGSEVWFSKYNAGSEKIAAIMEKALREDGYTKSRGLRDDREAPLSVLYYNEIPSVLVETGFLSNSKDAAVLSKAAGQERIAKAMTKGILNALELKN